jgi:formylglycine-generating enzyme required for sulfatase activity
MCKRNVKCLIFLGILAFSLLLSGCGSAPAGKDSVTIDMIHIPAGEFEMGQDADIGFESCQLIYEPYGRTKCKPDWFEDEEPVHTVYLDDFYIDKFEITNADYQVCVENGICDPPNKTSSRHREEYFGNPEFADYPVIYVDWFKAQTYCEWRGARLPTEAEWEKAARGTDGRTYPWGNEYNGDLGNFCDRDDGFNDGYDDTAPVGSYPGGASPYGVLDLGGNVWEWVYDVYGDDYFATFPEENPQGPSAGSTRVFKGGTWYCELGYIGRAAERGGVFPDKEWNMLGFRCASSTAPE